MQLDCVNLSAECHEPFDVGGGTLAGVGVDPRLLEVTYSTLIYGVNEKCHGN